MAGGDWRVKGPVASKRGLHIPQGPFGVGDHGFRVSGRDPPSFSSHVRLPEPIFQCNRALQGKFNGEKKGWALRVCSSH